MQDRSFISIIIPIYNERENIKQLHKELMEVLQRFNEDYEIIYIDDGSTDGSISELLDITNKDNKTKIIQFERNRGQSKAMYTGMSYSKGEIIIFIDGDLQNDPQDIPRLLEKLKEGYDLVSGWRKERKDSLLLRKIPSLIANKLISKITGVKLHDYGCSLKAYKRGVIKDVKFFTGMHRFLPVYASLFGAKITEIEVSHRKRTYGKSKYSLFRIFEVLRGLLFIEFFVRRNASKVI